MREEATTSLTPGETVDELLHEAPDALPNDTFHAFSMYLMFRSTGAPIPEYVLRVFDGIAMRALALTSRGSVPDADERDPFRWALDLPATIGRGNAFSRERTRLTRIVVWGVVTDLVAENPAIAWAQIDGRAHGRVPFLDLDTVSTYRKKLIRDLMGADGGTKLRKAARTFIEAKREGNVSGSFQTYLLDAEVVAGRVFSEVFAH